MKMTRKHNFNYKIITTKGQTIKSKRKFKSRSSAIRVLNMFYPGCVIVDITTDKAGDFGADFRF